MPAHKFVYPVADTSPIQFITADGQYAARPDSTLYEVRHWLHVGKEDFMLPLFQSGLRQWVVGDTLVSVRQQAVTRQIAHVSLKPNYFANDIGYSGTLFYSIYTDALGTDWAFTPGLRDCYKRTHSPYTQRLMINRGVWYSSLGIGRLPDQTLLIGNYYATLAQPAGQPNATLQRWPTREQERPATLTLRVLLPLNADQTLAATDNGVYLLHSRTRQVRLLGLAADSLHSGSVMALAAERTGRICELV